jgi:hypothetical protein
MLIFVFDMDAVGMVDRLRLAFSSLLHIRRNTTVTVRKTKVRCMQNARNVQALYARKAPVVQAYSLQVALVRLAHR